MTELEESIEKMWAAFDENKFYPVRLLVLADAYEENNLPDWTEALREMVEKERKPDEWLRRDGTETLSKARFFYEWTCEEAYLLRVEKKEDLSNYDLSFFYSYVPPEIWNKMKEQRKEEDAFYKVFDPTDLPFSNGSSHWISYRTRSGACRAYARAYASLKSEGEKNGKENRKETERAGLAG